MLEIVLHTGTEHPNLLWIFIPSILSFLTGLGFGVRSDRLQKWLRPQNAETTN